ALFLRDSDCHSRLSTAVFGRTCSAMPRLAQDGAREVQVLCESTRWSPAVAYIARDFVGPVLDLGHVLEKHRPPIEYADDQISQLARVFERLARIHTDQAVAGTKVTGHLPDVRDLDRPPQLQRRN